MRTETEVIFGQDGSVLLQADGGWCHRYETPAAAAWDTMRTIKGSDPDFGWPHNTPGLFIDTSTEDFRRGHQCWSYALWDPFQKVHTHCCWVPSKASEQAVQTQESFAKIIADLDRIPGAAMAACERGDIAEIQVLLHGMYSRDLDKFLQAVLSVKLPAESQEEVARQTTLSHRAFGEMELCQ